MVTILYFLIFLIDYKHRGRNDEMAVTVMSITDTQHFWTQSDNGNWVKSGLQDLNYPDPDTKKQTDLILWTGKLNITNLVAHQIKLKWP